MEMTLRVPADVRMLNLTLESTGAAPGSRRNISYVSAPTDPAWSRMNGTTTYTAILRDEFYIDETTQDGPKISTGFSIAPVAYTHTPDPLASYTAGASWSIQVLISKSDTNIETIVSQQQTAVQRFSAVLSTIISLFAVWKIFFKHSESTLERLVQPCSRKSSAYLKEQVGSRMSRRSRKGDNNKGKDDNGRDDSLAISVSNPSFDVPTSLPKSNPVHSPHLKKGKKSSEPQPQSQAGIQMSTLVKSADQNGYVQLCPAVTLFAR